MNERVMLDGAVIDAPASRASVLIDASNGRLFRSCEIRHAEIFIGPRVEKSSFVQCLFKNCVVSIDPAGVGSRAFKDCYFRDCIDENGKPLEFGSVLNNGNVAKTAV